MARAQKGDPKSGHRPIQGRHDDHIRALCDVLGNLVRFVLLAGQRHDTIGVSPLIQGLEWMPRPDAPLDIDRDMYKSAAT
jgi:hypothetical protein